VSVIALQHSGDHDRNFEPEVPHVHLHNADQLDIFEEVNLEDSEALALEYVNQLVSPSTYLVKDSYETKHNGIRHVYLKQTANDLEILNADLNINILKGKVLNVGHSFYLKNENVPEPKPQISSLHGLHHLGKHLGDQFSKEDLKIVENAKDKQFKHTLSGYPTAISDVKVQLGYVQMDNGQRLELAWAYEVDVYDHWWNAYVSATSGEVLALYDWINEANYNVYPIGVNDPEDGPNRHHPRHNLPEPHDKDASPLGWHRMTETGTTYTDTRGNNVYAQENWSGGTSWQNNYRPSGGSPLDFDFTINFNSEPEEYVDASTSNLFFWNSIIHDVFWHYGFDEPSGNFQENNFGRGGLGNDAVQANCQDGSGYNNANFATPPDGQRPRMRMYIWSRTTPYRDGDLDSGIIIHEYGHGISIRLTGGPQNVNCLSGGEAGGMGEGWGDWWATALRQRVTYESDDQFAMGGYDTNTANGIRKFPYTTDMSINPETYSYITRSGYEGVHAKGEVWCGILWEVYWNFVNDLGFDTNWIPSPNPQNHKGNVQILQDVVDGLKLQPCRPNFVDARDAILAADRANYGGANLCRLWRGFAKRGLGTNAVGGGIESFVLPAECR
jgi:extracellular elastinolytic metalloproteinase